MYTHIHTYSYVQVHVLVSTLAVCKCSHGLHNSRLSTLLCLNPPLLPLPPSHQTYASQVRAMQVMLTKLQDLGKELASNETVGGRDALRQELDNLIMQWEPLKDNVFDRYIHCTVLSQHVTQV